MFKTLMQAVQYFSDKDRAHEAFVKMRWPDGVVCPRCGSKDVSYSAKYRRFECKHRHERRQFTVKTGSILEDSPIGLDKWAVALWLEANAKNSISSYEVQRSLGVTQKTAWFMLHRIREALRSGSMEKMGGSGRVIEADETYVGGRAKNMHWGRRKAIVKDMTGGYGKAIVHGVLERNEKNRISQVAADIIPDTKQSTLISSIRSKIKPGSTLYTDLHTAWRYRPQMEFVHRMIDHVQSYVDGQVHTNGIENFWSLFKRCIKGTHVSVDPVHLQRYLDSEVFRFNNRKLTDSQRLELTMQRLAGKRLTYKALTSALGGYKGSGGRDAASGSASV